VLACFVNDRTDPAGRRPAPAGAGPGRSPHRWRSCASVFPARTGVPSSRCRGRLRADADARHGAASAHPYRGDPWRRRRPLDPRDMARYLAALLGGGANEHGSVLKPETLAAMFAPQHQPDPPHTGPGPGVLPRQHRAAAPGSSTRAWCPPSPPRSSWPPTTASASWPSPTAHGTACSDCRSRRKGSSAGAYVRTARVSRVSARDFGGSRRRRRPARIA
jgi:hypothetical protein